MTITISGKNVDIGESLRSFITDELTTTMEQCVGDFIAAHVVLTKHNGLFRVDMDVHVARGFTIRSSGQDADPYNGATQAIAILKQRTTRYKARLRGRDRRIKDVDTVNIPSSRFVLGASQEEEQMQEAPLIIAEMPDMIATLAVGDAVMQLDLSELPVLIFKNASSGELNVVYRRTDGNIGWVAPKPAN